MPSPIALATLLAICLLLHHVSFTCWGFSVVLENGVVNSSWSRWTMRVSVVLAWSE